MNENMLLSLRKLVEGAEIVLPASKSIHNRAVLISNLAGGTTKILNPSNAHDSKLMSELIYSDPDLVDARDAGTTFRFLTAYYALKGRERIITGTERMKERPVGLLVNALRDLGAKIEYLEKEGFPPIRIQSFTASSSEVSIPGNVSSQYISALLMIGPCLPQGIKVILSGPLGSRPYVEMTIAVMRAFGAGVSWKNEVIQVEPGTYKAPENFWIEPDWSAASYWYSFLALAGSGSISIPGLMKDSTQGDRVIADIMEELGVLTEFTKQGITLRACGNRGPVIRDFSDCPDLAQTVVVIAAALGTECIMTGLESLRIKETDRIAALQAELSKFGCYLEEKDGTWKTRGQFQPGTHPTRINTYKDHRMAMSFAPLCTLCDLQIEDPQVTAKSYPRFWDDVAKWTTTSDN